MLLLICSWSRIAKHAAFWAIALEKKYYQANCMFARFFDYAWLPAIFITQIREQMSGPEISWYGKSILGCGLWPWLVSGKKWSGPILSNFFGWFFQFFVGKKFFFFEFFLHCSVRTKKLHKIKLKFFKKNFGKKNFLRKTIFF